MVISAEEEGCRYRPLNFTKWLGHEVGCNFYKVKVQLMQVPVGFFLGAQAKWAKNRAREELINKGFSFAAYFINPEISEEIGMNRTR